MKVLELILMIVAVLLFLADASPKISSAWRLSSVAAAIVTAVLTLLFIIPISF